MEILKKKRTFGNISVRVFINTEPRDKENED